MNLFRKKEVRREKLSGKYVYFSSDSKNKKRQIFLRKDRADEPSLQFCAWRSDLSAHELKAAILFRYIAEQRRLFVSKGLPVVSIDAKKKELVGNFKNDGATFRRNAENVNVYDFPAYAKGKVTPYGIYDIVGNKGAVSVGTSFDTPSFAADSIMRWWKLEGVEKFPSKKRKVLILADGGGSNSNRSRVWKYEMQNKVRRKYGLEITVCHYSPECSKYNPIEHSLFSAISENWKDVPLRSYETIVNDISTSFGFAQTGYLYIVAQSMPGYSKINAGM